MPENPLTEAKNSIRAHSREPDREGYRADLRESYSSAAVSGGNDQGTVMGSSLDRVDVPFCSRW